MEASCKLKQICWAVPQSFCFSRAGSDSENVPMFLDDADPDKTLVLRTTSVELSFLIAKIGAL